MIQSPNDRLASYRTNQGQSILFGQVVAGLMMLSVLVAFAEFGSRLFEHWNGTFLVIFGLLVSLEAIYTRTSTRELEARERLIFRASEWVAFAVVIKLLLYLVKGPAQLMADLPLWQANFIENFFTGDYIYSLFAILLVWACSMSYAGEIEDLNDSDKDTVWDELGKLQNALHDIRNRIASRAFVLGGLVVILSILTRLDIARFLRPLDPAVWDQTAPIINVVFYFILVLVLLSQTQFALLRTRWMWQRLPISPAMAGNWIKYGLIFFAALGAIVLFLPTNYSIGLFDTLRIALNYLMQAFSFIMLLITLPFTLCMSLLSLFSGKGVQSPAQPAPAVIQTIPPASHPIPWLEFLRSLAFWIVFLGVIIFAVRFYFSQNIALWNAIVNFPLFRWLSASLGGLWKWVRGANRQITGLVQDGLKRLRAQRGVSPAEALRRMVNLTRMNPRERIIYFYTNLVQLGGERGLERRPYQTPYQYENQLGEVIPEVNQDLHDLTDTFLEARYSQHPVDEPQSTRAGSLWERIKEVLRGWKREEPKP